MEQISRQKVPLQVSSPAVAMMGESSGFEKLKRAKRGHSNFCHHYLIHPISLQLSNAM